MRIRNNEKLIQIWTTLHPKLKLNNQAPAAIENLKLECMEACILVKGEWIQNQEERERKRPGDRGKRRRRGAKQRGGEAIEPKQMQTFLFASLPSRSPFVTGSSQTCKIHDKCRRAECDLSFRVPNRVRLVMTPIHFVLCTFSVIGPS